MELHLTLKLIDDCRTMMPADFIFQQDSIQRLYAMNLTAKTAVLQSSISFRIKCSSIIYLHILQ